MRIGLGDSSQYLTPPPAGFQPTAEYCLPFSCFADGGNNAAARALCADAGMLSAKGCVDSECAPYRSDMPPGVCPCNLLASGCPTSPSAPAASIPQPIPPIPVVKTTTVATPLPSLTDNTQPVIIPQQVPSCSLWCVINGAIDDHPLIAIAVLVGAAYLVCRNGKR